MTDPIPIADFIERVNNEYMTFHSAYEENFWATKMNLAGNDTKLLTSSKTALDNFLGNKDLLGQVER